MRNLLPLLWALLILWFAGCTYWYVCHIRGHCGTATSALRTTENAPSIYSHPYDIKDGSFSAKANDNIRFRENTASPTIPDVVSTRLAETVKHANDNKRTIDLIGYYMNGEPEAVGMQRAERVKAELVRMGANENQITTKGRQGRGLKQSMGQVHGAISLALSKGRNLASNASNVITSTVSEAKTAVTEVKETVTETAAAAVDKVKEVAGNFAKPEIREKLSAKDLNLYFESGSTKVIMTDEIRDYFDNLKVYLDANPTAKVRLIGHTDNEGSAASNLRYGRQRAERIKAKLMKGGIKGSQVVTQSKGQTEPIATNDTDAGRKLNRRVAITIN